MLTLKSDSLPAIAEIINNAALPARTMSNPSPLAKTFSGSATMNENGLPVISETVTTQLCSLFLSTME